MRWYNKPGKFDVAALIGILISIVVVVVLVPVLTSVIDGVDTSKMPKAMTSLLDILPIVFVATVVLGAISWIGADEETFAVGPIKHYVRIKRWDQFGTRLKVAYKAKFGYANSGFDQRVDELILSMRATSNRSLTYKQNEEALKRLSKFVEVKFKVPEEGKWSEKEKTRVLDRELHAQYEIPWNENLTKTRRSRAIPIQAEPTQVRESDGFAQLGALSNLAMAALMADPQPEAKEVKKEPEYQPDAGYEEETYKADTTPVVQPILDIKVPELPGEFANEPTPEMVPKPRRGLLKRLLHIREEEKVPVRTKR
jgi:hypothetical protein